MARCKPRVPRSGEGRKGKPLSPFGAGVGRFRSRSRGGSKSEQRTASSAAPVAPVQALCAAFRVGAGSGPQTWRSRRCGDGLRAEGDVNRKEPPIALDAAHGPGPAAAAAGHFTHPWVGQAEHLACRKRPPNAFCGQKPAPTFAQEPSGVLKHRAAQQESTPVTAVPALCADFAGRVRAVPLKRDFSGVGPRVGKSVRQRGLALQCPRDSIKFRERTPPGALFRALWGRSSFVLG